MDSMCITASTRINANYTQFRELYIGVNMDSC